MKPGASLACAILLVAAAGSDAKQAHAAAVPAKSAHAKPAATDWTHVVKGTPAGGFVMGNPNARVKLIEYGSMTCPHCRHFDETGVPKLLGQYVKTGRVSYEFRNYVRDALDLTASLLARCNGAKSFFTVTRALYKEQPKWEDKVQGASEDQVKAINALPLSRKFAELGKLAGFQSWAAASGMPAAKSTQCLTNEAAVKQLVEMTGAANDQFPDFKGTPTFVINGTMIDLGPVTEDQVWPALQAKIDAALKGRG
jgi:protein-disulfide isomerase